MDVMKCLASWPCLLAIALACHGQSAAAVETLPSRADNVALQCLVHRERSIDFPGGGSEQRNEMGLLRVMLHFEAPDRAPKVEILANTATPAMQEAALDYIDSYRLPCMTKEQSGLSAVQEFIFDALAGPEGKPLRLTESDAKHVACIVMPGTEPDPGLWQSYGNRKLLVLAQMRFAGDAQQPPDISFVYSDSNERFESMVREYLAQYRMPCRKAGDEPREAQQMFVMIPSGAPSQVFSVKQIKLVQFLSAVKDIKQQRLYFDLSTMGCPFQLEWTNYRPATENQVTEVGSANPNRAELMAWLKDARLRLSDRDARALFGASLVIDVPCGQVDLKPASTN